MDAKFINSMQLYFAPFPPDSAKFKMHFPNWVKLKNKQLNTTGFVFRIKGYKTLSHPRFHSGSERVT